MRMTEQQFREWAASATLAVSDSFEFIDSRPEETHFRCEPEDPEVFPGKAWGCISREMTGTLPDGSPVTFCWQSSVEWVGDQRERYSDEFEVEYPEGWIEPEYHISAGDLTIVDEDDDEIGRSELADLIRGAIDGLEMPEAAINQLIPALTVTDITEDSDMEIITLENDNAPDVRFNGELVAKTSSSPDTASSYFSGSTGRYTILSLYKTAGGKFVAHKIGVTQWQGERDRNTVKVCENVAEVVEFFGHGWLAKDLYFEAGITDIQEVE